MSKGDCIIENCIIADDLADNSTKMDRVTLENKLEKVDPVCYPLP